VAVVRGDVPAGREASARPGLGLDWLGWIASALAAVVFALVLGGWLTGGMAVSFPWAPTLDLRLSFALDGLGALYALLATGVGTLVFAYGTGYLTVAAWLQVMGEAEAWKYMDALHENIAVYTHSGSAPCVQAAKGERMAGIGFDMRGAREKSQGAPIDIILPSEGAGWDMEATGIVKGTKNLALAKKVADWGASKQASELYSKYYALVAEPSVKNIPQNYPATAEQAMVKNDFAWMAENRDRILAEWSKRYESKAAPKN